MSLTNRARRYVAKPVVEWKRVERTKPPTSIEAKKAARNFIPRVPSKPLD